LDIAFTVKVIDIDVEKLGNLVIEKKVIIRDSIGVFIPKIYGGTTLEET
jgi:hypothetical protein